jgi:Uma2 family endonuclease
VAQARPRMTLEEFLALPEEEPALEYEDGEVTQKVSPNIWHSGVQNGIAEWINGYARPRRLARAFPELRARFPRASRVPDVAVYVWDRIPRDDTGKIVFTTASAPPDIAIEVVSPGQRINAVIRRLLAYVAEGVRVAVSVDPDDESVVVVRPDTMPLALSGKEVLDLGDDVAGLQTPVARLFDALRD